MHLTSSLSQILAEFLTAYEAKLTAGYSETYTSGQNAGVTVSTQQGQHATVTAGKKEKLFLEIQCNSLVPLCEEFSALCFFQFLLVCVV